MPWLNKRDLDRLERDLLSALQRAEKAEEALSDERKRVDELIAVERRSKDSLGQAKDFAILQLASRVVTKHGGYGLEAEPKSDPGPTAHPKGFLREPSDHDLARLEYYKQCYRDAGKSEDEAQGVWEAEMRGEDVKYEYEQEQ